jgi:hypothetical protein
MMRFARPTEYNNDDAATKPDETAALNDTSRQSEAATVTLMANQQS